MGIEDRLFFAVGTLDRWSDGLSSYAVANAHHTVLDAIDQVIATNDEDGVAQVVERLFPARAAR
ncbi:MAG TPA: HAD hydrolase family protein [Trebonia sp.]